MNAALLAAGAVETPAFKPLFLTEILVSYEDAARLLSIRDTYDWHQKVWEAFNGRDGAKRDFLTRLDRMEDNYRLLIVSSSQPHKPDWCPTTCFKSKSVPESYFSHERYRFSLIANPTRKIQANNPDGTRKKNGRRIPLIKREELDNWI